LRIPVSLHFQKHDPGGNAKACRTREKVVFCIYGRKTMNIQIFGRPKCFDTKKAERHFKERGVKYQFVDIGKYGISRGEYQSVKNAVGGMAALIDENSKEYESLGIKYLSSQGDAEERLLENPGMFKTPIVRNGKQATVGLRPEVWGGWT